MKTVYIPINGVLIEILYANCMLPDKKNINTFLVVTLEANLWKVMQRIVNKKLKNAIAVN
jgi:hypothetical protein